jgi:hypothetical protein
LKPYRAFTPFEVLVGAPASFCVAFVEFDLNIDTLPFCLPQPWERVKIDSSVHPAYTGINSLYVIDYITRNVVARDGVEPPTPAFSELIVPVFPTTSMVAVGLPNTGRYDKNKRTVGDRRG